MLYQNRLIDLLDRKFNLVNELSSGEFILELENFIRFIDADETLSIFAARLLNRLKRKEREYGWKKESLVEELIEIRQRLVEKCPTLDDSDIPTPTHPDDRRDLQYHNTLANFDRIVNSVKRKIDDGEPVRGDDEVVNVLIGILQQKLSRQELDEADYDSILLKLSYIKDSDVHLRREINNYRRASAESSLMVLYDLIRKINPSPQHYESPSELIDTVIQELILGEAKSQQVIQRIVYEDEEDTELIRLCKIVFHRAYEGLRGEIDSNLIHYEILNRYKARCTWYDRQRLEKLIAESTGNEEDALTGDLALYLFDNGISIYRVRRGVHEYDLMGHRTPSPIFVEVKVYKNSKHARGNLIQGVAQLHSYLNSLEAEDLFIEEAYYVIYRLGGPLYDLPWEIPTSRRTFFPFIVDLGLSQESGRRQSKPISITMGDFFDAIAEEERKDGNQGAEN